MYAGKMGKTVSVKKYKNREKQTMKKTTEFTPTAFILGILLAVVFGGANAFQWEEQTDQTYKRCRLCLLVERSGLF